MVFRQIVLLLLTVSSLYADPLITRTRVLMGTFVSLTLPANKNQVASQLFDYLSTIEKSLSTFDTNASLAKLNRDHCIAYDPILSEALVASQKLYQETYGYFDVTIGSITKTLYRFGEDNPGDPTPLQLQQAKRYINGFSINGRTIESEDGIVIDLGGMGKGFAVDKAAAYVKQQDIAQGIIALSGDIRCLHPCALGIQSPFHEHAWIATVQAKINDLSVSTSGTYRRFALKKSAHHLINPKSAHQGDAFTSVTLFAEANNTKVDAYATAVSVMPEKIAFQFLASHPDIGYILVKPNGQIIHGNTDPYVTIQWSQRIPKHAR